MKKRIIKIGTTEMYEDDAMKIYQEGKYVVNYGGVYQLHHSKNAGISSHKVINQKGIAKRGRFHVMSAKEINNVLETKVLNED